LALYFFWYFFGISEFYFNHYTGDHHGHAHPKAPCTDRNNNQLVFLVGGIFAM
jgi:hypothetical protein